MKKLGVMLGITALLPMVGSAAITVTAAGQSSGFAYIYDSGGIVRSANFAAGEASINTDGLAFGNYGLATSYDDTEKWVTDISVKGDALGGTVMSDGYSAEVKAVTGSVTDRSFTSSSTSVTLSSNGSQLQYNDPTYDLNADILLYRPATALASISTTKTWKPANLNLTTHSYSIEAGAGDGGLDLITVENFLSGEDKFIATYLGQETAVGSGVYNLGFEVLASGDAGTSGSIGGSGDDVVFTINSGFDTTDDATPYYVEMEYVWMYDSLASDASSSQMMDGGLDLTNPTYYAIPEPASIMLIMGAGGALFAVRRIFTI